MVPHTSVLCALCLSCVVGLAFWFAALCVWRQRWHDNPVSLAAVDFAPKELPTCVSVSPSAISVLVKLPRGENLAKLYTFIRWLPHRRADQALKSMPVITNFGRSSLSTSCVVVVLLLVVVVPLLLC
mgnify:CR=1 FL=1